MLQAHTVGKRGLMGGTDCCAREVNHGKCETHAVHLLGIRSDLRSHLSEKGGLKQPKGYAAATLHCVINSLVVFVHPEPLGFDYHWFLRIGSGARSHPGGGLRLRASLPRAARWGQGLRWPLTADIFWVLLAEHLVENPTGRILVAFTTLVDVASKKTAAEEVTDRTTRL